MGKGSSRGGLRALVAVSIGVVIGGCSERPRVQFTSPGDGVGPLATILAPVELDTVRLGEVFGLSVRFQDPDGVDSLFVRLDPNVNTLQSFGAAGAPEITAGDAGRMPDSLIPPAETLYVHAFAVDVLGDTGAVATRRLLIQ